MANKGEDITGHNYVADQLNWEQRVKTEVEAPRQWSEQWGPIFQEEKEGVDPLDEGVRLRELLVAAYLLDHCSLYLSAIQN